MKQKINLQLAHNPVVTCQLLDQPTDLSFPNNLKKENFDSQFKISQKRSSNHSIDVLLKNESDKNGIWDKKSFKINGVDQIDFSDNISPKLAILIDKIFEKCDNDANQKNTNQVVIKKEENKPLLKISGYIDNSLNSKATLGSSRRKSRKYKFIKLDSNENVKLQNIQCLKFNFSKTICINCENNEKFCRFINFRYFHFNANSMVSYTKAKQYKHDIKNSAIKKTDNYLFNLKYAGKIVCQLSKNESDFKEKYVIDTSKVLNIENNTSNTLCDKCKGVIFNFHNMCSKCGVYICFKCSNVLSQLQNRPGKLFCYRHQEICIPKVVYTYDLTQILKIYHKLNLFHESKRNYDCNDVMDLDLLKLDQENSILKLSNYETFLKESIQLYSKLENYFDESRFNKTNDTINYIYLSNMVNEYVLIELKNLVKCTNSDSISNIINSDINIEMKKNFKFTNGINNTPLELLYIKHVDDVNNLIYSFCFNDYLFYSIYKEDITIYWDITLDGRKSTIQQKSCNCAILPMGSFYKINPSNDCMLLKLNVLSLKSIYNYYKIDKSNILANDYLPSIEKLCVYQFIKLMKH